MEGQSIEMVRIQMLPDGRLSRENAALYLGVKEKTLAMWALRGQGPAWLKVGGRVFYFKAALDEFIYGGKAA